ncbi:MAG: three-Cys-motif partner protein TcmP [Alphaproteobacteria bacterium]
MADDDGLPVSEVGEWTLEKHDRLRRYVDITRAIRKRFVSRAGATYTDLFSGPGRSRIRETGQMIDGSPIVATTKALEGGAPFTKVFIADIEQEHVSAASTRLAARGVLTQTFAGPAEETVRQIVSQLDPYALHFAFLDPFNLDALPFTVIETLAKLKRMDILIHVSAQDLQRNLRRNMPKEGGPLDRAAPGWREVIDPRESDKKIRVRFLDHWLKLIRSLNMAPSQGIELVSGSKNQPLYWLVLVSRHPKAGELWEKICNITPQRRLDP